MDLVVNFAFAVYLQYSIGFDIGFTGLVCGVFDGAELIGSSDFREGKGEGRGDILCRPRVFGVLVPVDDRKVGVDGLSKDDTGNKGGSCCHQSITDNSERVTSGDNVINEDDGLTLEGLLINNEIAGLYSTAASLALLLPGVFTSDRDSIIYDGDFWKMIVKILSEVAVTPVVLDLVAYRGWHKGDNPRCLIRMVGYDSIDNPFKMMT